MNLFFLGLAVGVVLMVVTAWLCRNLPCERCGKKHRTADEWERCEGEGEP